MTEVNSWSNLQARDCCQLWWENVCPCEKAKVSLFYSTLYCVTQPHVVMTPVEKRDALGLYCFATGDRFWTTGHLFCVSKAVIWHEVASRLNTH